MRNPLYVGGWFMSAAMALIMPPTGALFALTLMTFFFLRLILAEEAFLSDSIGESYRVYLHNVPRLCPRLHSRVAEAHHRPHWLTALLTEINPIGVFVTIAVLSWTYNHWLMLRGILISFGVSLVVRALMPHHRRQPTPIA
jgi:protein-S-isoprenylcysteine O-methyltransferase Ste14